MVYAIEVLKELLNKYESLSEWDYDEYNKFKTAIDELEQARKQGALEAYKEIIKDIDEVRIMRGTEENSLILIRDRLKKRVKELELKE